MRGSEGSLQGPSPSQLPDCLARWPGSVHRVFRIIGYYRIRPGIASRAPESLYSSSASPQIEVVNEREGARGSEGSFQGPSPSQLPDCFARWPGSAHRVFDIIATNEDKCKPVCKTSSLFLYCITSERISNERKGGRGKRGPPGSPPPLNCPIASPGDLDRCIGSSTLSATTEFPLASPPGPLNPFFSSSASPKITIIK